MMMMMMRMVCLSRSPCYRTPRRLRLQKDQLHLFAFQHLSGNTLRSCPRHQSLLTFNQSKANPVIKWLRLGDCTGVSALIAGGGTTSQQLVLERCLGHFQHGPLWVSIGSMDLSPGEMLEVDGDGSIPFRDSGRGSESSTRLLRSKHSDRCPGLLAVVRSLLCYWMPSTKTTPTETTFYSTTIMSSILVCYYGPDICCLRVARTYHITNSFLILTQQNQKKKTSRVFMQNPWQIQNAILAQFACKHTSTPHNSFKTQEHRIVS